MVQNILAVVRDWYITAVGAFLIVGGLYLASNERAGEEQNLIQPAQNFQSGDVIATQEKAMPAQQGANAPAGPSAPSPQTSQAEPKVAAQQPAPSKTQQPAGGETTQLQDSGATTTPGAPSSVAGDVAKGEQVFKKCRACHSIEAGKNLTGPSLAGVFGRKAGEIPNYNYSPAMKNANIVWDAATLDSYLADPKSFIPGNKMAFPGVKNEAERQGVIAYLASQSSAQGTPDSPPASQGAAAQSP
jgi:nitrite reductase (NO-forming)